MKEISYDEKFRPKAFAKSIKKKPIVNSGRKYFNSVANRVDKRQREQEKRRRERLKLERRLQKEAHEFDVSPDIAEYFASKL